MRRRTFISSLSLASGAAITNSDTPSYADQQSGNPFPASIGSVMEPAREIPVLEKTDVLVIGGGAAGVAASIAASRGGASTILVERYNHLGGLWTGGLVLPLLSTHGLYQNGEFKQVIYGIGNEIAQKLKNMGMAIHEVNPVVDPEAAKYVLDMMIQEAGVKIFYHCWASNVLVDNRRINTVILESKSGRVALQAKVVIDCTGDGDIFTLAGEEYTPMKYMIGLVHRLGNVDRIDTAKPGYTKLQTGEPTPHPSVNWVNMVGEKDQNGVDLYNLSRLQQKYRLQIWEATQKIRSTPGYEEVFLLDTAPQLGVRMSRILHGDYVLTLDDSMTYRSFKDVIGVSGAWTSVQYNGNRIAMKNRPLWQIPYRSLLPKKTKNLLVAGRCFSFENKLVEDARIIGTCLVTGQAAGAAAAVMVQTGTEAPEVDITRVQKMLKEQNVYMG
jgi:hypothetical protein